MSAGLRRHWDSVAEDWLLRRPDRLWGQHADQINARYLRPWLPDCDRMRVLKSDLFDEAWRDGMAPWLEPRARELIGIDLSFVTAHSARRRHATIVAVNADARGLPFREGAFDVVISNSTLDHFRSTADIVASLGELHRVLRPGGDLLLTLDNGDNPVVALRNAVPFPILRRVGLVPYFVGVTLRPARLRRALCTVGFEVRDIRAAMHCPRLPAVCLSRVLERRAAATRARYLRAVMGFERMATWPTRFLTAHFVAVRATRGA